MSVTLPTIEQHTSNDLFLYRLWLACIWAWPLCIITFALSFVVVAGFLPPPLESASAADIAAFYAANRTTIRAGLIGALFASALLLPFFTVVSAEMRKIEGRNPLLAPIQFGGAVILTAFFQIICIFWLLASFRPEANPEIIRAFNDYGWLVWTMLIPTYSLQFICMGIAGFMDTRDNPIWPRWSAYLNIWVAVIGAGGVLAVYMKTGPFSWNGIIGIWLPVAFFAIGMSVNAWLLLRRAKFEFAHPVEAWRYPTSATADDVNDSARNRVAHTQRPVPTPPLDGLHLGVAGARRHLRLLLHHRRRIPATPTGIGQRRGHRRVLQRQSDRRPRRPHRRHVRLRAAAAILHGGVRRNAQNRRPQPAAAADPVRRRRHPVRLLSDHLPVLVAGQLPTGTSPEIIRAFNDYGWLVWTMLIPTFTLQFLCMAVAGFMDTRDNPIWPRWSAYLNIWIAVTGAGGVLVVYMKHGPFSWNGIIGIWLPVAFFALGTSVNAWLLWLRAKFEFAHPAAA